MIPLSVSEISALGGFCDVHEEELGILVVGGWPLTRMKIDEVGNFPQIVFPPLDARQRNKLLNKNQSWKNQVRPKYQLEKFPSNEEKSFPKLPQFLPPPVQTKCL